MPDFLILTSSGTYFMEVKAPTGRLSPEQKAFQADVENLGIPFAVVRSTDEAARYLKQWNAIGPLTPG